MKKTTGIVIAVIVTVLTMGTAFGIQHYVSQGQSVAEQDRVAATSSRQTSQSTASSSVAAAKKTDTKSSSRKTQKATHHATQTKSVKASTTRAAAQTKHSAQHSSTTASSKAHHVTKPKKTTSTTTAKTTTTTQSKKTAARQSNQMTVHLTVTGYKKTFFKGNVKVSRSANAFTVLKASKLKLDYQNGVVVYVSGVNGLSENDIKTGSGWKYRVNGKFIDQAANQKKIKPQDSVHWYFTTEGY